MITHSEKLTRWSYEPKLVTHCARNVYEPSLAIARNMYLRILQLMKYARKCIL